MTSDIFQRYHDLNSRVLGITLGSMSFSAAQEEVEDNSEEVSDEDKGADNGNLNGGGEAQGMA